MTRGSRCRARQFRRPVCWRTSSTTATGTALVRTPSVTCPLSCRPSTRQQPFWPMAAHSIPRAPPVLPFQQNLLLVQHLWISILCKTLLNGIGLNGADPDALYIVYAGGNDVRNELGSTLAPEALA